MELNPTIEQLGKSMWHYQESFVCIVEVRFFISKGLLHSANQDNDAGELGVMRIMFSKASPVIFVATQSQKLFTFRLHNGGAPSDLHDSAPRKNFEAQASVLRDCVAANTSKGTVSVWLLG